MGRLVQGLLGVVTLVGAFALYVGYGPLRRMSADASADDASVWVYTPHVAPGDTIHMGVSVHGGADIGIEEIVVRDGERELRVRGGGADWGSTIMTRRTAGDAEDSQDIEVQVPPDARPGATLHLRIEVRYAVARQFGVDRFTNDSGSDEVTIDVAVRSPAGALFHRGLSAGWALGLLAALCLLAWWGTPRLERWLERTHAVGDGEIAGLFLLLFTVVNAMFIGHGVFALPLVAATGWTSTWFIVVACGVWAVSPYVAAWRGVRHDKEKAKLSVLEVRAVEGRPVVDPGGAYRAEPDAATAVLARTRRATAPFRLSALGDALRAAGYRVQAKGKRLWIEGDDGKGPSSLLEARDPEQVTADTLIVRNRDMREAIDVLHAALPVLGPVELRLPIGNFLIDGRSTRAELRREFDEAFQGVLDAVKRSLRPLDVASLVDDKPGTLR